MSEHLLIYRGGRSDWAQRSPEEQQLTMQKWAAWIRTLVESGQMKDPGQPLDPVGKVVRAGHSVSDGPYAEKDLVGGYSIVEAADLDQATALTAGCPIFDVGGVVEVRPIVKMSM